MSDMELGPEERSVIAAARDAHIPSEVQRARIRRGLDAKLAAGVAAPLLAGSTAMAMTGKIGATIALVAAVGAGTAYVVTARPEHKDGPPPALHKAAPRVPAASPSPRPPPPTRPSPREDARTDLRAPAQPRPPARGEPAPARRSGGGAGPSDPSQRRDQAWRRGPGERAAPRLRPTFPVGQVGRGARRRRHPGPVRRGPMCRARAPKPAASSNAGRARRW